MPNDTTPPGDGLRPPKQPSKGKLRAQALEQARRERKERSRADRFRLLGLPGTWPDATGRDLLSSRPGSAAPPARPGQYADVPGSEAGGEPSDRPDTPEGPRRRRGWQRAFGLRTTVGLLIGIAIVAFVTWKRSPAAPPLARSCVTPAVAVLPTTATEESLVRYAITGPPTGRYALTVDAVSVRPQPDGTYRALPPAGSSTPVQAVAIGQIDGCLRTGGFALHVPAGNHRMTLLRIDGATATVAATAPLAVTPK